MRNHVEGKFGHKGISEQDITFCSEEFEKRKLLKRLEV